MHFPMLRTCIAASVAAIALAACGGHGIVPSQSAAPGNSLAFAPEKTTNPCAASTLPWYFKGSCTSATVTSKGGMTMLAATGTRSVTMTFTLGATNAKGKVAFLIGDAATISDITPNGMSPAFPRYGRSPCAGGPKECFGKVLAYVELVNSSKAAIKVKGNSQIAIAAKSFPGPECAPAVLTTKGWDLEALLLGVVKKRMVTFSIPGGFITFPAGPSYLVFACSNGK
jgi:hypothetical protein